MRKLFRLFLNFFKKSHFLVRTKECDAPISIDHSNRREKKALMAASSSIFYKIVSVGTGLVSIPLTMNYLGDERFGMWMICTSIFSFMTFADLGMGNGLVNVISKNDGLGKHEDTSQYVSSVFFILLGVSIAIGIFMFLIFPYVNWEKVFNVNSSIAVRESSSVILILTAVVMMNLPLGVVQKVQIGYQQSHVNNIWLSLGSILGLVGVLVSVYFEAGLPWLVGSMMGGPLIANAINGAILFFYDRPNLLPSIKNFRMAAGKSMVKLGFVFFLLQMFSLMANTFDNIIIAQVLGASSVATYAIAKKVFIFTQLSQHFIVPLWPAFNEAMARGEYRWARSSLEKIIKASMLMGALCALPVLIFGDLIIQYWVNSDVTPSFYLILGLFFWTFLANYGGSLSVFLNNSDFIHKQLVMVGLASISSLILEVILCYWYGVEGVIYGVILGHIMFFVVPAYRLSFGALDELIKKDRENLRHV